MGDLLLDDIGLSLLCQLHEAWEALDITRENAPYLRGDITHNPSFSTESIDRYTEYERLTDAYISHLHLIRDTPDYTTRRIHRLQHFGALYTRDVDRLLERLPLMWGRSDMHHIVQLSLEYYQWWMNTSLAR